MSIQVTIVRDDAAQTLVAEQGTLLSELLHMGGHPVDLPCGGKGRCGRCRVVARGELSPPSDAERRLLTADELAAGLRLACLARVVGDATVEQRATVYDSILTAGEMPPFDPDPIYNNWGIAVDIGTTTMAAQLYGRSGFAQAASMKNPQAAFGADVISRIERSLAGEADALARSVRGALQTLTASLTGGRGIAPGEVEAYVITGNTAMLYLLAGQNPDTLSHAPFEADRLFGERVAAADLDLGPGATVYLPRCMSAFVGADITTAVLASGMTAGQGTALLCDIGTNGEIALWHKGALHCCSTAAGPAFEGAGITMGTYGVQGAVDKVWVENGAVRCSTIGNAAAVGICGSGIVDAVAAFLEIGVVDETGAFQLDEDEFILGGGVVITAEDIRKVQLAKGSVRAGIETLLETVGVAKSEVGRLYIAGGFGSYLNLESAAAIGLIPGELLPVTSVIGNAAQTGAAMLLRGRQFLEPAQALAKGAATVELSGSPVFMEHYMEHMMFDRG